MSTLQAIAPRNALEGIEREAAQYFRIDARLRQSASTEPWFKFFGANQRMIESLDHHVMLAGPAETGKTFACCEKLHRLCMTYPNTQAAIVRKTYASMPGSVLQTFARVVQGSGAEAYGGAKAQWFDYPHNESRVWVGGMDHPDKVLSSERDAIYINQAEELDLSDWETLRTRATGRAGHVPNPQVFGDCNPGVPTHWIKALASQGKLPLLESRHEDNPTLFNQETGEITDQGKLTLSILDQLTGPRKARLRFGQWAGAEGMVYEDSWDAAQNVIAGNDARYGLQGGVPQTWRRYLSIDFGFTNPFVCQWWAEDGDGRLFRYREIYKTQTLVEDHAREIKRLSAGEHISAVICDHDAEGRATFTAHSGMSTVPAKKDVLEGIQAVASRLKPAADKKPRLLLLRDSLVEADSSLRDKHKPACTEEEVEGYVWRVSAISGRKEESLKENDHGADAMRYMVAHLDMGEDRNLYSW